MSLIRVKPKFQVTIPANVREKLQLQVGDLLEAEVQSDRIVLTPKAIVDKGLKESLDEAKAGKLVGPFKTAKAVIKALKGKAS